MNKIIKGSNVISNSKTISSVKKSMDGEERVLKAEIKTDTERGRASKKKIERVATIEDNISKLAHNIKIYNDNKKENEESKNSGAKFDSEA